jgi:hypothetical protein
MAFHDDLLEQANHLAMRERSRPRQASLRRAVSSAYYALFHLLATEGARQLAPPQPAALRVRIRRAFAHARMKDACRQFRTPNPPDSIKSVLALPLERDLILVASAFIALQEARHEADYDLGMTFNRIDVLQNVQRARTAFASWQAVRARPNAAVFLAALILQNQWK